MIDQLTISSKMQQTKYHWRVEIRATGYTNSIAPSDGSSPNVKVTVGLGKNR